MTDERQVRSGLGNQPVYPQALFNDEDETWEISGLTKREHYAALFVAGLLANSSVSHDTPPHDLARVAIAQADVLVAMLNEADRGDV